MADHHAGACFPATAWVWLPLIEATCHPSVRSIIFLRAFNGLIRRNFTFSPRCCSDLSARIGDVAWGKQWPEFSMKSWRIPAWQRSLQELSCSLPQPSSAKPMQKIELPQERRLVAMHSLAGAAPARFQGGMSEEDIG